MVKREDVLDLIWAQPGEVTPLPIARASRVETWQVGLLCGFLFTILYWFTLAPSVGAGHDSGELTVCCLIQGVPHPPGYPLYVCLGWLAGHIPFGEPAYRINLLSALELGAALGFLGAALTLICGKQPALLATLLAGVCTAVWRQAVIAEVFALHLLFLCALIWLAILWEHAELPRRREIVIVTGFILGCTLAHQHIIALAAPSFLAFGILRKGRGRKWGFNGWALLVFILAWTMPYAVEITFARQQPAINWGEIHTSWQAFEDHFLRRTYGTGMLNAAAAKFDSRAGEAQVSTYFISLIRNYYPFPAFLLLLLGVDRFCQQPRNAHFVLFGTLFIFYGPWFGLVGNQPSAEFYADLMERFYSSSMIGAAGILALGVDWFRIRWPAVAASMGSLLFLIPLYCLWDSYPKCSQRGDYYATDLMQATLREVPVGSLFLVGGDLPAGATDYLHLVEGKRWDLVFVLPGLAGADWFLNSLPAGLRKAALKAPEGKDLTHELAMENMVRYVRQRGSAVYTNEPQKLQGTFLRVGLSYRYFAPDEKIWTEERTAEELEKNFLAMESVPRRGDYRMSFRHPFWIRFCISEWIAAYQTIAKGVAATRPEMAARALDHVVEMQLSPSFEVSANRAGLRLKLGRYNEAAEDYELCLQLRPDSPVALEGALQAYIHLHNQLRVDQLRARLQQLSGQQ